MKELFSHIPEIQSITYDNCGDEINKFIQDCEKNGKANYKALLNFDEEIERSLANADKYPSEWTLKKDENYNRSMTICALINKQKFTVCEEAREISKISLKEYEEKFMNVKNKHKNRKPGTKISNFWMNQQQIDLYIENFRIDNFNEYALRPNVAIFIDFLSSIFEKAQKNLFSDRLYKFMKNITNMLTSFHRGDILWQEMKEFYNQNWEIVRTNDKYFEDRDNKAVEKIKSLIDDILRFRFK